SRDKVLMITGLTKHQLYHRPKSEKSGKRPTHVTRWKNHTTDEVIERPNEELVIVQRSPLALS
ncbi:MAG: hypothetical protein V3V00_10615, partial [Saprospiraceae bacterium]